MAKSHGLPTNKIKFTPVVFKATGKRVNMEIMASKESQKHLRAEIARTFQQANRRIQNIEKSGLISPAVSALNKGDVDGYSKFSMRGKDWTDLKIEYGKAVSFLRQPTSTASGTRQYNKHLQKQYDLTETEFNLMAKSLNDELMSLSDSNFVERYLMQYKDFTGELEQTAKSISSQIESDSISITNAIQQDLENEARKFVDNYTMQQLLKDIEKFGL